MYPHLHTWSLATGQAHAGRPGPVTWMLPEWLPVGHVWGQFLYSQDISKIPICCPQLPCCSHLGLNLQKEWWNFRHTDPRMEQGFLECVRRLFLEPPKITSCRCHLHLAQFQHPWEFQHPWGQFHQSPAYRLSCSTPKTSSALRTFLEKEKARRSLERETLVLI